MDTSFEEIMGQYLKENKPVQGGAVEVCRMLREPYETPGRRALAVNIDHIAEWAKSRQVSIKRSWLIEAMDQRKWKATRNAHKTTATFLEVLYSS
jgi:hypothetical protein